MTEIENFKSVVYKHYNYHYNKYTFIINIQVIFNNIITNERCIFKHFLNDINRSIQFFCTG